jgi:hypothetical protein
MSFPEENQLECTIYNLDFSSLFLYKAIINDSIESKYFEIKLKNKNKYFERYIIILMFNYSRAWCLLTLREICIPASSLTPKANPLY